MIGPPGSGKTKLAKRLRRFCRKTYEEQVGRQKSFRGGVSAAGVVWWRSVRFARRTLGVLWRDSRAAAAAEALRWSLAHYGVLFLSELPGIFPPAMWPCASRSRTSS